MSHCDKGLHLRKYLKVFTLGWQEQLEYRANSFLESVIGVISFIVLFFLWQTIYRSNHGPTIAGLTFSQMLSYLLLAKFWDWVIDPSVEIDNKLPEDIRNGGLNRFLTRPISDRLFRFSLYLAHKSLYGAIRIVPMLTVLLLFPTVFKLTPVSAWWLLPVAGLMALILQFSFSYMVAVIAFWWLEIWGLLFLKRIIVSFLAGAWVPLTILPEKMARFLSFLPFQYMIFFPVQMALGKLGPAEIQSGLLVQALWIIFFVLAGKFCWSAGMKQYTAAGA